MVRRLSPFLDREGEALKGSRITSALPTNRPQPVVCLSQGPSFMTRQSPGVLDSVPLLAGASCAEKSSAGDVARVRDHPRSVRERTDSASPHWPLSVDAVHRKSGRLRRASPSAKFWLRLQRLVLG